MKIAVVGNGPASLAAAWAAEGMGHDVYIYGPGEPSILRGPVLLQRPIPGITLTHPDAFIRQIVVGGSILDYRKKLYGDVNISINGDILEEGYHAWRMEDTYQRLWDRFHPAIEKLEVSPAILREMSGMFDLVVNTAPAKLFCQNAEHRFVSKEVFLTWDTQIPGQADNTIYFNAEEETRWVRSSSVFGNVVTEWPERITGLEHRIEKPISTDCDCNPEVFRTGRFGAWKNETWVDTAYYETRRVLLK